VASVLPESNDTDLTEDDIIRRVNEELVSTWGNLVNRVVTITVRNFDGRVPEPGDLTDADQTIIGSADRTLAVTGELIEKIELRAALRTAMEGAGIVNAYLNATEPWKLVKTDQLRAATVLWTSLQAIAALGVAFTPFLPFSSMVLREILGVQERGWRRPDLPGGTTLGEIVPLFAKIPDEVFDEES
jgi:methionyl-tRNA synthetase